eukprot:4308344-Amphidinium_carterae.1
MLLVAPGLMFLLLCGCCRCWSFSPSLARAGGSNCDSPHNLMGANKWSSLDAWVCVSHLVRNLKGKVTWDIPSLTTLLNLIGGLLT